jgi:glycosyltransferase involved in cell wall biosynthesis
LALVDAFSAFVDAQPRATLVLVGSHPSPYDDSVRREVELLGVEERIRIVDIDPETYRYYRCADILVSASDTESLPRSFLEAMAFGVPILAADVFGVGEVVSDNVHGWLFESGSGVGLLAGLRRALGTPREDVAAMSARSRASAAGFSSAGYAQRYADLIRSCQDRGEG